MLLYWCRVAAVGDHRTREAAASAAAHTLAELLARRLFPGERVCLEKRPSGQPYWPAHPEIGLSLAHGGGYALAAAGAGPVGVDVEALRQPDARVLRRLYTETEQMRIARAGSEAARLFTRLWTVKEADAKARGLTVADWKREATEAACRGRGMGILHPRLGPEVCCTLVGRAPLAAEIQEIGLAETLPGNKQNDPTQNKEEDPMIRVAMLSGWHVHAEGYAREANRLPGVQVTCVWDEDRVRGERWARELGVAYEPCLETTLAREDVDAVIVCTATNRHKEVILKAARAGKHIFTEKVLALNTADCLEIAEAVRKAGVKFAISFPHRTMSHNLFAKKAVEAGWLGQVTLARVRNAHDGVAGGWLPPHFFEEETCGGGAMMDLGAHPMYLLAWLLGRPVSVSSLFTQTLSSYPGIEDNAVSLLEFPGGVIGVSETGFVSANSPFELEIYGTQGSLFVGGPEGIRLYRKDGDVAGFLKPDRLPEELPQAMTQWVSAIRDEGEILFGLEEGILLTEIMEAAYTSQKEKRRVEIPAR